MERRVQGGNQGNNKTGDSVGNSDQKGEARSFVQNGFEHFNYKNPASSITVAVVSFFVFSGGITLTGYIVGSSKVEEIVYTKGADAKLDRNFTIREKFAKMDENDIYRKMAIDKCSQDLSAFMVAIEPRLLYLEGDKAVPTKAETRKANRKR
ncbi:MAG TPA: hypothetical protein PLO52_00510 [Flavobacterium alvei]|nr:hypothetical protein [Flavobacterium alvei]